MHSRSEGLLHPEACPPWEPLGARLPKKWLPVEEGQRLLSTQHLTFIRHLMSLLQQNTPAAAAQGIALLDTVPRQEEHHLDLLTLRAQFLTILGQAEQAQALLLDHLFAMHSEELWLQRGNLLVDWLVAHPDGPERASVLSMLRDLCATQILLAPPMILSFALSQGHERPPTEARELYASVLRPKRWRPHPKRIAFWLEHLAAGFFSYIDLLVTNAQHDEARRYGRMLLKFPWDTFPNVFTPNALHLLCLSLFQLEMWTEQKQLCERMLRTCPDWGEPHYWLGGLTLQRDNPTQALQHFRKALQHGGLDEAQKRSMLHRLMSAGVVEGLDDFFAAFEDKEHLDTLRLNVLYHLYRDELEAALQQCDAILALVPDDLSARLYSASLLEALQRWDEAEALLRSWLTENHPTLFVFGHLLLGNLHMQAQRFSEALTCFQALLDGPFPYQTVLNKQWQRSFLLLWAECLQQTGDLQAALERYREAHALAPSGLLATRILWLMIRLQHWDDAEQFARRAKAHSAEDPWFQCATLQLHEHFERWEPCLAILTQLGLPWFHEQGILRVGLLTQIRALLACDRPWDALVCCEQWLEFCLQDDELKDMRQQIFAAAQKHVEAMQQRLGEQAQQLVQLDNLRSQWQKQRWEHQKREELFHQVLQQEGLHQEMRSLQQRNQLFQQDHQAAPSRAPQTSWEREHPERFAPLPNDVRPLLVNAALLWDTLASHPEQDHGPIVLQLARVVETEVYRHLLAPLFALAQREGIQLSELPALSVGSLTASQHRISLADASALLYATLQTKEPDGSITTLRNPRSNQKHQRLLQRFWQEPALQRLPSTVQDYFQTRLPLDLKEFAQLRNRVSHASQEASHNVMPRRDLLPILDLLWGDPTHPGILDQLAALSASNTTPQGS